MKHYLLPIHHQYAAAIYDGTKRYEVRNRCPNLQPGDVVYLYETKPVQAVTGYFYVKEVIQTEPFWFYIENNTELCIEPDPYFKYTRGHHLVNFIKVGRTYQLPEKLSLLEFDIERPPQSWRQLQFHIPNSKDIILDYIGCK